MWEGQQNWVQIQAEGPPRSVASAHDLVDRLLREVIDGAASGLCRREAVRHHAALASRALLLAALAVEVVAGAAVVAELVGDRLDRPQPAPPARHRC